MVYVRLYFSPKIEIPTPSPVHSGVIEEQRRKRQREESERNRLPIYTPVPDISDDDLEEDTVIIPDRDNPTRRGYDIITPDDPTEETTVNPVLVFKSRLESILH
ncbi:MAG: hypothetical protein WC254_01570 [Candidatus Woesearchaeota archaeon]|jgi:hypothetical protein